MREGEVRERKGAGRWRSPPHDGASAAVGVDEVAAERCDGGGPSAAAWEQWSRGGAKGRAKEGFGGESRELGRLIYREREEEGEPVGEGRRR
jgi:hypothetical protein